MVKAKKECVRVVSGTCQANPGRVRDQAEPAMQTQNWCQSEETGRQNEQSSKSLHLEAGARLEQEALTGLLRL